MLYRAPDGYFIRDFVLFGEEIPPPVYTHLPKLPSWNFTDDFEFEDETQEEDVLPIVSQTLYLAVALEGRGVNPSKIVQVVLPEYALGNCTQAKEEAGGDPYKLMKNPSCVYGDAAKARCNTTSFYNPLTQRCELHQVCCSCPPITCVGNVSPSDDPLRVQTSEDTLMVGTLPAHLEVRWRNLPTEVEKGLIKFNCTLDDLECIEQYINNSHLLPPFVPYGPGPVIPPQP